MTKTLFSPIHIPSRTIFVFTICVLSFAVSVQTARANGAPPPEPDMGGVAPYQPIETNVQMMSETVLIDVRPHPAHWNPNTDYVMGANRIKVTASFTLRNQGTVQEQMQVVFPLSRLDLPWMTSSYDIISASFVAKVDGKPVPTTEITTPPELHAVPEGWTSEVFPDGVFWPDVRWAAFDVTFPVQQDVIVQVEYDMWGYIEMGLQRIDYIIETGAGWYGRILSGDIILRLPYPATRESVPLVAPSCIFSGNEVQCHLENYEPRRKDNLAFGVLNTNEWPPTIELRARVEQHPEDADAWYKLSKSYQSVALSEGVVINQDMLDLAGEAFEKAVALQPDLGESSRSPSQMTQTPALPTVTPAPVSGILQKAIVLAAGNDRTCVLTEAGAVRCRGSYPNLNIDLTGDFTAVAAGDDYICVLLRNGAVKCLGKNTFGQLGDGTTDDRATPVDVVGLNEGVSALVTGANHTCALMTGGGVKCWGRNYFGQLGDGTMAYSLVPVDVAGLPGGVAMLAAGSDHTCAVMQSGGVKCWGANEAGQLGDGSLINRLEPVDVVGLPEKITGLAAGFVHTCALNSQGQVLCWGDNSHSQLGNESPIVQPEPILVPGLDENVIKVVTGAGTTCVLTRAGGVKCWGTGDFYDDNDKMTLNRSTPSDMVGLTHGIVDLAAGNDHTCALFQNGEVKCWGLTYFGATLKSDGFLYYSEPVDAIELSIQPTVIPSEVPANLPEPVASIPVPVATTITPPERSLSVMDLVWDFSLLIAICILVLLWKRLSVAGRK